MSSEGEKARVERQAETSPESIFIISVAAAAWFGDVKEE